ncbi:MAG: DUF4197 domain-containing protein [Bacteroidetes bacterium]|nr:MAG: DUF4197 domain-containing protein [Bacteroidota bacterium]
MIKKLISLTLFFALTLSVHAQFKGAIGKLKSKAENVVNGGNLSEEEVGQGLKEALNAGVGEAVRFLSAEDGYYKSPYKILLPEEARKVTDKLKAVPQFRDVETKLEEKMNRAAELAAAKAKPIFVSAIRQMTFRDAMNILMGEKDAATRYLQNTTYDPLFAEFQPVIQQSLDEVNAREYWHSAVSAYNKLPFVEKVNPELDAYVTEKALAGLFALIEQKEADIRQNSDARNTELLRKVFARQDRK